MSFIRPEAARGILRWVEPVIGAGVLALLIRLILLRLPEGSVFGWLALIVSVPVGLWLRAALGTALAARQSPAPGIVVIREGEVGYFGPEYGGFVALDDLREVLIAPPGRHRDAAWMLRAGMVDLVIPAGAEGADALLAELTALPGFPDLDAAATLRREDAGVRVIWRRRRRAISS